MGRIKRGRPSNKSQTQKKTQPVPKLRPEYIADDYYAQRLFKLIATSALYKNIVLTGPAGSGRASGNQLSKVKKDTAQEIKNSNKELKQTLLRFGLDENHVFFLNSQPKKFILKDDKIVDETTYEHLIKQSDFSDFGNKFEGLIIILNLILKELDKQFAIILIHIFDIYCNIESEYNVDEIIKNIIDTIRQQEDKYKYLLQWEQLKMISNESRYRKNMEGLDKIKEKIQQKTLEPQKKKTDKIQNKYNELIKNQEREYNLEHDNKPIDLFISEFIKIIHECQQFNIDNQSGIQNESFGQNNNNIDQNYQEKVKEVDASIVDYIQ